MFGALCQQNLEAKVTNTDSVNLWGDGSALREFLHVNDLARACLLLLEKYNESDPINVGFGSDLSILELAAQIAKVVGFNGKIIWDKTKPNGTPKKLLDSSRMLNLGWSPEYSLESGISETYSWFLSNI